jgi:electron transfer flavoprotein alpha subunit
MARILVFVEQRDHDIKKITFENLSLAYTLSEAAGGSEILAVVIGDGDFTAMADQLGKYGAGKFFAYTNENLKFYNGQGYAKILAEAVTEQKADIVLMGATAMGKDLAPRVGARLNCPVATDCISVKWTDGDLEIIRPMYAGKVRATIRLKSDIKIVTVRPNVIVARENPSANTGYSAVAAAPGDLNNKTMAITSGDSGKLDVTEADIIVSGGRGLKGPENFHLIESLAKKLGAAQGASRAVVDAGWRPYSEQVGQTGKTVSPSLYIAVGISGAIQHLAGMSSSKYIVAINKDPEAPIFKIADYGIVGDAFEILPKLIESL